MWRVLETLNDSGSHPEVMNPQQHSSENIKFRKSTPLTKQTTTCNVTVNTTVQATAAKVSLPSTHYIPSDATQRVSVESGDPQNFSSSSSSSCRLTYSWAPLALISMFLCTHALASSFAIPFLDSPQALRFFIIATHF